MSSRTTAITEKLYQYLLDVSLRESELQQRLRAETAELPERTMQISPEQGQFMEFFLRVLGARRCIEVGTFTGYSTLSMARALPDDGRIIACDLSREWTDIARRYWEEAGVDGLIDLRIGPANETLDALLENGEAGRWDFAFIDADKTGYDSYYEQCLDLLRSGGIIAVDNTLWHGKVADETVTDDEDTQAIRRFNDKLRADERVDLTLVPIGDGLTLARKREGA